jgi:tetratricopeptide (TPR) repeat protein
MRRKVNLTVNSVSMLLWLVPIIGVGGLLWFLADVRFAQQWALKRAQLGAQDKWRELNAHFESGLKCRRPMLLLFQRFVIPGTLEADYALHLSNQGEHERALVLARKASLKSARRLAVHIAVLPAEATILLRLGRYEEAKEVVRRGRSLLASPAAAELAKTVAKPDLATGIVLQEGLIELCLGHLDAALRLGLEASAASVSDPARALISGVLTAKGRFPEALEALVYEPSNFDKFLEPVVAAYKSLEPDALDVLAQDQLFQETACRTDEELSGVFGPAVEMGRALVFLEVGDATNLGLALERTHSKLKSNQIMEHIFIRTRACWHAMKGDVAGVEADLARTRQLAAEKPASRSAKYETHLAAGRARFLLGQHHAATDELSTANRLALHPMEKHTSTYWLARATETAGQPLAASLFKTVVADNFGTWMQADALARSA